MLDTQKIKTRAVRGVLALSGRTFFLQIVALIATFLLTVYLSPEEYGVFIIVSAAVNFLVYFSDIGLAAALIQKKEELKEKDLASTFTIQQALVALLVIIGLLLSTRVAAFYHLNRQGLWLFRALVVSFFLSSLKTIPSILLERKLYFDKLVIPQILETIVFYSLAVWAASRGMGVASFTGAVLVRSLVGLVAVYIIMPWRPRLGIDGQTLKRLLHFGVPFQANSLLALVKDDLLTVFLGKVLPMTQIGYIGWGQKWAFFPLRFFMDAVNKVMFPAFARLQHQKELLAKAVEKAIYLIALTVFPTMVGLMVIAPYAVELIPKYQKWQPALICLVWFCVNGIFSSISTTLTNILNAIGRIKLTLYLMVFWTTLTWLLTIIMIRYFGYAGAAAASALVTMTFFIPISLVKRYLPIKVLPHTIKPLSASLMMGVLTWWFALHSVHQIWKIGVIIAFGILVYGIIIWILDNRRLKAEFFVLWKNLK